MSDVSAPNVGFDDAFFWEGVERDELLFQVCASCHEFRHPPRPVCPHCHSVEWTTRQCAGGGEILSWMIPRHPPPEPGQERIVILVELDEGIRMVSNLQDVAIDDVDKVANGMPVHVVFREAGGTKLPQFVPDES